MSQKLKCLSLLDMRRINGRVHMLIHTARSSF
nr:MAG TPA: hypothetical protein [Caudoviricetes sp.]